MYGSFFGKTIRMRFFDIAVLLIVMSCLYGTEITLHTVLHDGAINTESSALDYARIFIMYKLPCRYHNHKF